MTEKGAPPLPSPGPRLSARISLLIYFCFFCVQDAFFGGCIDFGLPPPGIAPRGRQQQSAGANTGETTAYAMDRPGEAPSLSPSSTLDPDLGEDRKGRWRASLAESGKVCATQLCRAAYIFFVLGEWQHFFSSRCSKRGLDPRFGRFQLSSMVVNLSCSGVAYIILTHDSCRTRAACLSASTVLSSTVWTGFA